MSSDSTPLTQAILETVLDGIITIDERGVIRSVNQAVERIFGYHAAEMIGRSVGILAPPPHRQQHDAYVQRYLDTGESRVIGIGRVLEGRRKDGSTFPLHLGVSEAVVADRRVFVGIMRDLSERRKAETARDRYFAVALDLLCTATFTGLLQTVNPAWSLLGHEIDELRGMSIRAIVHPDDVGIFEAAREKLVEGQPQRFELRLRCSNNSYLRFEWSAVAERDQGLIYAGARNVTHRAEVDRLKSEFISTVSHELRTPLTSIRGSLGLLEGGVAGALAEKAQQLVQIARTNTDRLIRLIDDILDLDKIESGHIELQITDVDAPTLVGVALSAVEPSAEAAGIALEQDVAPIRIRGDHDRLVQVLVNLMANAVKFSPTNGTVTVTACPLPDGQARFSVRDNGPGIPPSHRPRLFHRFEQGDASDRRAKGGTGLGLAISKAIIEQHGGTIDVISEPGNGAEFYFILWQC